MSGRDIQRRGGYEFDRSRNGNGNGGPPAENGLKQQLIKVMNQSMDRMMAVLPKHFTPEKTIQIVTICAVKTPKLLSCDPLTFVNAIVTAGSLGLDINPTAGEAWLIPRGGKVVFQPGYRGLAKLMKAGGEVDTVQCRLVYKNEIYIREYNPDLVFRHVPDDFGDQRDEDIVLAYCDVKTHSGDRLIEVMNRKQILASRDRGKAGNDGPWVTDFAAMAKRCPIVPMSKWITLTPPLQKAFEAMYEEDGLDLAAPEPAPVRRGASDFRQRIEGRQESIDLRGLPGPVPDEPEDERPVSTPPPRRREPQAPPPQAPPERERPAARRDPEPPPPDDDDTYSDDDLYDRSSDAPIDAPASSGPIDADPSDATPASVDQFFQECMRDWQGWYEDEYRAAGFTPDGMGQRAQLIDFRTLVHEFVSLGIDEEQLTGEEVTIKGKGGVVERNDFKCVEAIRKWYGRNPDYFKQRLTGIMMNRAHELLEAAQAEASMQPPAPAPAAEAKPPWVAPDVAERARQAATGAPPKPADADAKPPAQRRSTRGRTPREDDQPELPMNKRA